MVSVPAFKDRLAAAMRHAGRDPAQRGAIKGMAAALGVSYQAVKKALDGESNSLAAKNNVKAANLLGVRSEWLATGAGPMLPAAVPHQPGAPWPFREITEDLWRTLSDQDRHAIERAAVKELLSIQADRRALGEFNPAQPNDKPRRAVA